MPLDRVSGQFFEVSVGDSGGRRATAICAVLGIARRPHADGPDAITTPAYSPQPVPGQRGAVAPRGHRLQSRQPPASARSPPYHSELVTDELATVAVQDRRHNFPDRVTEWTDGTDGFVDAVMGAAFGPYRKSRLVGTGGRNG